MILASDAEGLSGADLRRFCAFLYARTGLAYGESKRIFVLRRLHERMNCLGTASFHDYMNLLCNGGSEAEQVINSFTVNETYFYREIHQLECLGANLLPEIVRTLGPGDQVRLWSLPCATGEEPYSIAIWLLENWRLVDAYNVDIVGSDIDTDALRHAAAGIYGERALARLPAALTRRYFAPIAAGVHTIIPDLRESVRLSPVNLIDPLSMAAQGRFDVIFCRNVLIYFDSASRIAAANRLFDALRPGGFVCLGHTESMARISTRFRQRRFGGTIVYQRPF